jgi:aminoglycoside phosphotransferase (APT) family kinase protein
VLVHGDLGAEHLLYDGTRITGVIDWSDAAVSDPELDFARLYRDFGPDFLDRSVAAYQTQAGTPALDLDRVEFFARCAALEDLSYGLRTGRQVYADAARRSLDRLFPG